MSVSATDLWPVDLVPQELVTPHQILMMQADALNARMEGLVTAEVKSVVIEDNGDSRTSLRFEIYSAVETRRVKLFEAAHRIDHSYPVALHGPDRLPAFLRERGRALTLNELYLESQRKTNTSEEVALGNDGIICATPEEFKSKLKELLASAEIKSAVMSMLKPVKSS